MQAGASIIKPLYAMLRVMYNPIPKFFFGLEIYEGSVGGTLLYAETQAPVTDAFGFISHRWKRHPVFGNIASISWQGSAKILSVLCGGESANGPTMKLATLKLITALSQVPAGATGPKGEPGPKASGPPR